MKRMCVALWFLAAAACGGEPADTPAGRYDLDKASVLEATRNRGGDPPTDPADLRALEEQDAAVVADMDLILTLTPDGRWVLEGQGFGRGMGLRGTWRQDADGVTLTVTEDLTRPASRRIKASYRDGTLRFLAHPAALGPYRFVRR